MREHVTVRDRTYEQHAQGIHRQLAAQEAEVLDAVRSMRLNNFKEE